MLPVYVLPIPGPKPTPVAGRMKELPEVGSARPAVAAKPPAAEGEPAFAPAPLPAPPGDASPAAIPPEEPPPDKPLSDCARAGAA